MSEAAGQAAPQDCRRPRTPRADEIGLMNLARNLKIDSVSRLCPSAPLTVSPSCSVADAVKLMRQKRVGCLLVCTGRKLVGVFTERDLLVRVLAEGRPLTQLVRAFMTPDPVTVNVKDPVRQAVKLMEKGGYRHMPVVDEAGRPVGILSIKRILHYLAEHFPATVYCQPPDPNGYPLHREGA